MNQPGISVVVASLVGPPFIDNCLSSLRVQAEELAAEVIVVANGAATEAARIAEAFDWVRVIHISERETVPRLRRRGVEQARAPIVAILEEHCAAEQDWLAQAVEALRRSNWAAAGGGIHDNSYDRLVDWTVYFVEYNGSLPPVPPGETSGLNGANIVYRRELLMRRLDLLDQGYWEATLHPALLSAGMKFLSEPAMIVRHCGPFPFGYYLRQRYWFSRAYAGARKLDSSARLAYLILAPVLPAVLLLRMAQRVFEKKRHPAQFLMSIPLLIPALVVMVAGEWVGYLAGPGDALWKVE